MYLVQILLPLQDGRNRPIPARTFSDIAAELTDRFGGVTTYMRAPADGRWKRSPRARQEKDQIVVLEVICPRLSRAFWRRYRKQLEQRFSQESILVRAQSCVVL